MKNHLTDRQLLDAQFKLCSDAQAEAIAAHLAECSECRGRANALTQKFAALDLLRGNVRASELLIAETLRQVRREPEPRTMLFPRLAWLTGLAATAAVIMTVVVTTRQASPPAGSIQLAKAPQVEPAMQVAMEEKQVEGAGAGAPAPMVMDQEAAEPVEPAKLAMAPKPVAAKGLVMERSVGGMRTAQRKMEYYAEEAGAPGWSPSAPEGVTVQWTPARNEPDRPAQLARMDSRNQASRWRMTVMNPLDHAVTASVDRVFDTTNWSVRVSEPAVMVTTQDPRIVQLTIEVPAAVTKTFDCTTIEPAEPAKGDVR